jgi:hypothetical protein
MGTIDLRCSNTLYGRLTDDRWLEVKCKRRACGYVKGTVVLHTIDITTGEVASTRRFSDPKNTRKEQGHAPDHQPSAVRSA